MTDTDKLTDIVKKVWHQAHGLGKHGYAESDPPKCINNDIIDLFKSLVPEEGINPMPGECEEDSPEWNRTIGWNSCRSQLLANIENLRK